MLKFVCYFTICRYYTCMRIPVRIPRISRLQLFTSARLVGCLFLKLSAALWFVILLFKFCFVFTLIFIIALLKTFVHSSLVTSFVIAAGNGMGVAHTVSPSGRF